MELKSDLQKSDTGEREVLIVPLWNWNSDIMQFPWDEGYVLIVPLWNWNFSKNDFAWESVAVLIVPLWNWNRKSKFTVGRTESSNRTFMELKLTWLITCQTLWKF